MIVFWYHLVSYHFVIYCTAENVVFNNFDFLKKNYSKKENVLRVSHPLNRNFFVLFLDRWILWAHLGTTQTNHERKGLLCVSCSNSLQQRNQFRCHYAANLFSVLAQVILILKSLTEASIIVKVVCKQNNYKYPTWLFKFCTHFLLISF